MPPFHRMTGWWFLAFLAMLGCSSSDAPTTTSPSPTAPFTFGTSFSPVTAYNQQVDRMGQPAIATAFLGKTYQSDLNSSGIASCTYTNNLSLDEACYRTQRDAFNRGTPSQDDQFFALMMTGPQDRSLLRYHYELGEEIRGSLSGTPLYLKMCSIPNKDVPTDPNIDNCIAQLNEGRHLSNPILPRVLDNNGNTIISGSDVITYDFSKPAGWPNGRTFDDPVVDRLLAASLLDLDEAKTGMTINTLVGYLNPRQDDSGTPSPAAFPHLRPAWPAAPSCDGVQATYSISSSVLTVYCQSHGFQPGSLVVLDFTSGSGIDGVYQVTSVSAINTFTVMDAGVDTSGYVTVSPFP